MSVSKKDTAQEAIAAWLKKGGDLQELENALRDLADTEWEEMEAAIRQAVVHEPEPAPPPPAQQQIGILQVLTTIAVLLAAAGIAFIGWNLWRTGNLLDRQVAQVEQALSETLADIQQVENGVIEAKDEVGELRQQTQDDLEEMRKEFGRETADARTRLKSLEEQVASLEPAPVATPSLTISLEGHIAPADQAEQAALQLETSPDGKAWSPQGKRVHPDGTGAFQLQVPEPTLYCRILITPPPGLYVLEVGKISDTWEVIPDPVTGFPKEVRSSQPITEAPVSPFTFTMDQVPNLVPQPFQGKLDQATNLRSHPSTKASSHKSGAPGDQFDVLGKWSGGKWRLACCYTLDQNSQNHFWAGSANNEPLIKLEDETLAESLPLIYLPEDFGGTEPEIAGWGLQQVDGLDVLFSQTGGTTQSQPLEWRLGPLEGWFRLEAWVARGSEGPATYEVIADFNEQKNPLSPLRGDQEAKPASGDAPSRFWDIGTYHLADAAEITVRLKPPSNGPIGVGMIRVIRQTR